MKLSEAIKLGSMSKPQGFEGTGYPDGPVVCAYGAALYAVGGPLEVTAHWPWLRDRQFVCPQCKCVMTYGVIPHLNNHHRWTRERIAEWVATIEPTEKQPTSESAVTSDTFTSEGSREEVQTNG